MYLKLQSCHNVSVNEGKFPTSSFHFPVLTQTTYMYANHDFESKPAMSNFAIIEERQKAYTISYFATYSLHDQP